MYGNTVLAVAALLHEIAQRAAASEYLRDGIIDAVAETFPYKLSQPPGSEDVNALFKGAAEAMQNAMAGASISIMKMDDELLKYYDMPCRSPYYNKF